jgi:hypothetical protein
MKLVSTDETRETDMTPTKIRQKLGFSVPWVIRNEKIDSFVTNWLRRRDNQYNNSQPTDTQHKSLSMLTLRIIMIGITTLGIETLRKMTLSKNEALCTDTEHYVTQNNDDRHNNT